MIKTNGQHDAHLCRSRTFPFCLSKSTGSANEEKFFAHCIFFSSRLMSQTFGIFCGSRSVVHFKIKIIDETNKKDICDHDHQLFTKIRYSVLFVKLPLCDWINESWVCDDEKFYEKKFQTVDGNFVNQLSFLEYRLLTCKFSSRKF